MAAGRIRVVLDNLWGIAEHRVFYADGCLFSYLGADERAFIKAEFGRLRVITTDVILAKYDFWSRLPFKLAALALPDEEESRRSATLQSTGC